MLAAISTFFKRGSQSEAIKKKEFLDAQKLDELLEQLTRVEEVAHTDLRTQQPVDLNYNCLQKEGKRVGFTIKRKFSNVILWCHFRRHHSA